MIQVVCFDIGGVLIRIAPYWQEAARNAKVDIRPEIPSTVVLDDAPCLLAYQQGSMTEDDYLPALAEFLGVDSTEKALQVHQNIMVEPYPDVERLVERLNALGSATACLSNTNALHWQEMHESGRFPANERLTARFASHEMKLAKPHQEIFEAFEREMGVAGNQIVFFDDTSVNVEAARQREWHAYLINPREDTSIQMQKHLINMGISLD